MSDNQKLEAQYAVSIFMACSDAEAGHLHIKDMGTRAFVAQGMIKAQIGDTICTNFHVAPSSGPIELHIRGTIINVQGQGETTTIAVKIDGYDSEEEKSAYLQFVSEVAAELEEL